MAICKKSGDVETCAPEGGAEVLRETAAALPRAALPPVCREGADLEGRGLGDLAEIEQRVVVGLACGQSAAEIADSLEITALAARVLIKGAYAALGVRSKAELLARLDGFPVH